MESNDSTLSILKAKLEQVLADFEKAEQEQRNREKIITSLRTSIQVLSYPDGIDLNSANGVTAFEAKSFRYPPNTSWRERIIMFMKYKNRAVTTHDIVEGIASVETGFSTKQILNMVSGHLSALVKEGNVKPYKPRKMKGSYYASPKWFEDGSDKLKEEHLPEQREANLWS